MTKAIYFDMDGTIANLYGVKGWLDYLIAGDTKPYDEAKPLVNMQVLARYLNKLQKKGYTIGIVSWLSKSGTPAYNEAVTNSKKKWLAKHLASVKFDEVNIVKYGTPKSSVVNVAGGVLFDDEEKNRIEWNGVAYTADNILETLKAF